MRVAICVISLWGFFSTGVPARADRLPNIIVLLADDLGYGETGCQGNPEIPTPHIDSLAVDGVRFTQGYVTASFCSPSRAGLLTGRYQTRCGHEFNPVGAQNTDPRAGLPLQERTLADLLTDSGYVTGLVGKWHLGGTPAGHPLRRGFDEFFGFLHEGHYFLPPPYPRATTWLRRKVLPGGGTGRREFQNGQLIYSTHLGTNEPDYDADNPLLRGGQPVVEPEYLTNAFTREAVDFIRRNTECPFLLLVSYSAVHSPMQAREEDLRRFPGIEDIHRRIFAAMLANLDDSVGGILEAVNTQGLDRDTLIFFLSDNGGPTAELTSSNAPLRGGKGNLYEGGIRVPFLARWTGTIPPGQVVEAPISSLDIFATVAEVGRVSIPRSRPLDGISLLPALTDKNQAAESRTLFWRQGNRAALRQGDWKIVGQNVGQAGERWELYNLGSDIAEGRDLSGEHREGLRKLKDAWDRINSEMCEPVWTPGG